MLGTNDIEFKKWAAKATHKLREKARRQILITLLGIKAVPDKIYCPSCAYLNYTYSIHPNDRLRKIVKKKSIDIRCSLCLHAIKIKVDDTKRT